MENWNKYLNEEDPNKEKLEEGLAQKLFSLLLPVAVGFSTGAAAADVTGVELSDGTEVTMTSSDIETAAGVAARSPETAQAAPHLQKLADAGPGQIDIKELPAPYPELLTIVAQAKHDAQTKAPGPAAGVTKAQMGYAPVQAANALAKLSPKWPGGPVPESIELLKQLEKSGIQGLDNIENLSYEDAVKQFTTANPDLAHMFGIGDPPGTETAPEAGPSSAETSPPSKKFGTRLRRR